MLFGLSAPAHRASWRCANRLFEAFRADTEAEYRVQVSYIELYNERLRDLLAPAAVRWLDLLCY